MLYSQEKIKPWLECKTPLTERLIACTGSSDMEVLSHSWIESTELDIRYWGISDARLLLREIVMRSAGITYWYARTLIPQQCYLLEPLFFDRLQQEPLSHLIFDEPKVVRERRVCYAVDEKSIEYAWVQKHLTLPQGPFWVRKTTLSFLACQRFYLLEFLLPALEAL